MCNDIEIKEIKWLKNRLKYPELDGQKLRSILYFIFIWSLFEKECCNNNARISDFKELAGKFVDGLLPELIDETWHYFLNRYVQKGKITSIFKDFKFKSEDNRDVVKKAFLNCDVTKLEKLQALLLIAFRLRNNLYHGNKNLNKFYEQNDNFRYINYLLMGMLDVAKK